MLNQTHSKPRLAKPPWLKVPLPGGPNYQKIKHDRIDLGLATVCEEARCPNIGECWNGGTATFMIMGSQCTRGCRFCAVDSNKIPNPLDPQEPEKLAKTLKSMDLNYVVITTVDRDDLLDQGASHIRACIEEVARQNPGLKVEILMPDFRGDFSLVEEVIQAKPTVLAHNIECVRRVTPKVRDPRAGYDQSLAVLNYLKTQSSKHHTKSSIMLGFGETQEEVLECMEDLRKVGTDFLTIGQYLQPTQKHLPLQEFVRPERFKGLEELGLKMGFRYVASGPLVRSSYKAAEYYLDQMT